MFMVMIKGNYKFKECWYHFQCKIIKVCVYQSINSISKWYKKSAWGIYSSTRQPNFHQICPGFLDISCIAIINKTKTARKNTEHNTSRQVSQKTLKEMASAVLSWTQVTSRSSEYKNNPFGREPLFFEKIVSNMCIFFYTND